MMLTDKRAEMLSNYLISDKERAKELLDLSADEAQKRINADGYDFTIEEIKEFGQVIETAAKMQEQEGELDEDSLAEVSGGIVVTTALLAAGVTLFAAGLTFGYKVARDRGW